MSKRNLWDAPKGWIDIGSDLCWDDHGGKWAKQVPGTRIFYVLRFDRMDDRLMAESGCDRYECDVMLVDLDDLPDKTVELALRCCGIDPLEIIRSDHHDLICMEACVGYGAYAPLESFSSNSHPLNLRGEARQYAERLMRNAKELERLMNRPVNRIGSTAREYMRGDMTSALDRKLTPVQERKQ